MQSTEPLLDTINTCYEVFKQAGTAVKPPITKSQIKTPPFTSAETWASY